MNDTTTRVDDIAPIRRAEAGGLAAEESRRALELLRSLEGAEWGAPTDCPGWDVRAVAGHVVGMTAGWTGYGAWMSMMRRGGRAAKAAGVQFIDGLTALQVDEQSGLTVDQLLERFAAVGEPSAAFRRRFAAPLRQLRMPQEIDGRTEWWRLAYLLDVILTRDTWMHRVDIARAVGRELDLTPEHDGRLVADVVAEWARRHGQPFRLHLTGPAGGTFAAGQGGPELELDAVEWCRVLSGRAAGEGLLAQQVPF